MPQSNAPDRQAQLVRGVLAVVGAILGIVGWLVWAT